jgi:hypothetical protein
MALPISRTVRRGAIVCFFAGLARLSTGVVAPAFAEGAVSKTSVEQGVVKLHLRGVRALGDHLAADRQFSAGLNDVAKKLGEFPFSRFALVSNEEVEVPLYRKRTVPFLGNQLLTVRPVNAKHGVVSLWLSWRDERGGKVLDTRVHLVPGEQMVAGTDSDRTRHGAILVISAR